MNRNMKGKRSKRGYDKAIRRRMYEQLKHWVDFGKEWYGE